MTTKPILSDNEIYVSPEGSDDAAGTKSAPLRSLKRARQEVRRRRQNGLPEGGIRVNLRKGVYRCIDDPLILSREDSGEPDKPVIWQAYQNETVIFSGGAVAGNDDFHEVTDPAVLQRLPESARRAVRVCDLSALGLTHIGPIRKTGYLWPEHPPALNVAVNKERYVLARYPNTGFLRHDTIVESGFHPRSHQPDPDGCCPECSAQAGGRRVACRYSEEDFLHQPGPVWTVREQELKGKYEKWLQEPDPWTFGYFCWSWAEDNISLKKIERIEKDGESCLQFTGNEPSRYGARAQGANGIQFYLYNLLCELDTPGEWYLDRTDNHLYLYPKQDMKDSTVEISVSEKPFIRMCGAENIALKGLCFTMGNANAVETQDCRDILIAGCSFTNMGQLGVSVRSGVRNRIQSCDFYRTGAGGVLLSGGDCLTLTPGENTAENCRFEDYAVVKRTYSPAIALSGTGNAAVRNQILNAPHQAISFAGNDHRIESNDISNVCYETADSGAIYSVRSWIQRGTQITNNYIHDMISNVGGGSSAVYLDDMISGIRIRRNLIVNMPGRVFLIGGGRDNDISNNIIVNPNTGTGFQYDDRGIGWAHAAGHIPNGVCYAEWKSRMQQLSRAENKTALSTWKAHYPELFLHDFDQAEPCTECSEMRSRWGGRPGGARIVNNILCGVAKPYDSICETVKSEAAEYGSNPVYAPSADLGFEDFTDCNFELKPDCEITRIQQDEHFCPGSVGLYTDEYRTELAAPLTPPSPLEPQDQAVQIETAGGTQFSWSRSEGAGHYLVEIFEADAQQTAVFRGCTQNTWLRVNGLKPDTPYLWLVTAVQNRLGGSRAVSQKQRFATASGDQLAVFDGFSDKDFTGWYSVFGAPSRCDGVSRSGRFSYRTKENQAAIEKDFTTPQHQNVTLWLFDTMQQDKMTASVADVSPRRGIWASIGVNVRQSADHYVVRIGDEWRKTPVLRSKGWHELRWDYSDGKACRMYLDGTPAGGFAAEGFCLIRIGDYWKDLKGEGDVSTILYDDLQIGSPLCKPVPTKIALEEKTVSVHPGEQVPVHAQLETDLDIELPLVWDTAEYEIARVTQHGVIEGLRPGKTVLTVHAAGFETPSAQCTILVTPV